MEALEDDEETGDKNDGKTGGGEHAAGYGEAEAFAGAGAGAAGKEEREDAEDECERGHHDGAEASAGGLDGGIRDGYAFSMAFSGHFHDEDGIFSGEGD